MTKEQRDALEAFFKKAFHYDDPEMQRDAYQDALKLADALGYELEERSWA